MKAFKTVFLIIEMVIGFGIPVYMWVFGVIMSPIIVLGVFTGGGIEMAAPLMAIVLGGVGAWGMLQLAVKVLDPSARITPPKRLLSYTSCGFGAVLLATMFLGFEPAVVGLILIPPLVVSAHFLYLARGYIWQNR